jgi:hypothetical protein
VTQEEDLRRQTGQSGIRVGVEEKQRSLWFDEFNSV